jgi:hypothetical protein
MPIRLLALTIVVAVAGCGSPQRAANPNAAESSPPGDIPDNQAYVPFHPKGAAYSFKVPEGWSQTAQGGTVRFTDKLNSIAVASRPAKGAVSLATVRTSDLPQLARSVKGYKAGSISIVNRTAGRAVRVSYLASAPADPVTGKVTTDAVERYVFSHGGREVVMTLSGPKGADNVDPWKLVTDSLRWTR